MLPRILWKSTRIKRKQIPIKKSWKSVHLHLYWHALQMSTIKVQWIYCILNQITVFFYYVSNADHSMQKSGKRIVNIMFFCNLNIATLLLQKLSLKNVSLHFIFSLQKSDRIVGKSSRRYKYKSCTEKLHIVIAKWLFIICKYWWYSKISKVAVFIAKDGWFKLKWGRLFFCSLHCWWNTVESLY